jgi:sn-glycerol 3-phosphate transport system permease protein
MLKRSHFNKRGMAYALLAPQLLITFIFFFWPAGQALYQAFLYSDPFGQSSRFVWFENFKYIFGDEEYLSSILKTLVFSFSTAFVSLAAGLLLAVMANRILRGKGLVRTLLIWPYAIAPAMAGVLWLFLFHPSYGAIGFTLNYVFKLGWNPVLNNTHAMLLVVIAAAWKQVSYNFVFFLSGLQSVPKSVIEAACIDGAGPARRFWLIVFPLLSPTVFFLVVMNLVYAFFDTFGVIHTTTEGGPGGATNILVYKVYTDGFVGLDLGSSSAQSVVLMVLTIGLTYIQFKYVEKKVEYGG